MSEMRVMCQKGDEKITWDRTDVGSINNARAEFNKLKEQGFQAFSLDSSGQKGEQLSEFDELAEKIIMVPAIRGGC